MDSDGLEGGERVNLKNKYIQKKRQNPKELKIERNKLMNNDSLNSLKVCV